MIKPKVGLIKATYELCVMHLRYAVLFSALINIAFLAPTFYMLGVYDLVVPSGSGTTLAFFTLALFVTLAVLVTLEQVRSQVLAAAGLRLDRVFATKLYETVMQRPAGRVTPQVGQLMREVDFIRAALTGPAALALMDAPWTPIYVLVCFLVHPAIGLLVAAGTILLLGLAVWNERMTRSSARRALDATARTLVTQDFAGASSELVRALGMNAAFVSRFQDLRARSHLPQAVGARATARVAGLIRLFRLLLQSTVLGVGAWLVIERQISAGSIFAASMLASRALAPMDQVVSQWRSLSQAISSFAALRPHLSLDRAEPRTRLPSPQPAVTIQNATVVSAGRDRVLLHDLTLSIGGGQVLGVLGPSGAGKTTLLEIFANAREPDQGEIRIDGARYSDWEPSQLGKFFGYVPQEPVLFPGSIKENIARFSGAEGFTDVEVDEQAVAAAREAEVHDMILAFPGGYDYEITSGARNLSAGQRQRLALARALYGEPAVLVLDEPDSALDGLGQAALSRVIRRARNRGAAVVFAAHSPALLASADILAVIEDGRLKMYGAAGEVVVALKAVGRPDPANATLVAAGE